MSDWRQIQARIRKAKSGADPATKLRELFQRTRDGMVAWELACVAERGGDTEEAVKWFSTAASRFRRMEWKKKAEEALARLGVTAPSTGPSNEGSEASDGASGVQEHGAESRPDFESPDFESNARSETDGAESSTGGWAEATEPVPAVTTQSQQLPRTSTSARADANQAAADSGRRGRRRGRRGGRGRRRGNEDRPGAASPVPSGARPQGGAYPAEPRGSAPESRTIPAAEPVPAPVLPSERVAHGRAGDPALASRMGYLENLLRRLVGSPLHRLDEADQAPAGPGVFLLSDSDQVTSYYIEACQTLRIGLSNLTRSASRGRGRGGEGSGELKSKLAEHLGIAESKVMQYLRDHCVVRWIQLDDDASYLAHFAMGVLRTPLNLEE